MSWNDIGNSVKIGTLAGGKKPLLLDAEARSTHTFVCGSTGTGKSKFLESLIRQDILSWVDSKCGLLLLDHHGAVYDEVMKWLAWNGSTWDGVKLPVVPIDLTQDDWVVGYNPLRYREDMEPWVVVNNLVESIGHVWNTSDVYDTPRLRKWLAYILLALYENRLSMLSFGKVINPENREFRKFLLKRVKNENVVEAFRALEAKKPQDFEDRLESTVSRTSIFSEGKILESMLNISDGSLDLLKALEEGQIILVNLSTKGGKVAPRQAKSLATLLLSDLWQSAKMRGKSSSKPKPFYVYADEFQQYVSPAIAENFNEARGFGLHMTVACQFPKQIFDAGTHGERLYRSIMENARTKVAFHLGNQENLELVAQDIFFPTFDIDKIKKEIWSTKVMDYVREETISYTSALNASRVEAHSSGDSWQESEAKNTGLRLEGDEPVEKADSLERAVNDFLGFETEDALLNYSENLGKSYGRMTSDSLSKTSGETNSHTTGETVVPILGRELSSVQFESLENQLHAAMAVLHNQKQRQFVAKLPGSTTPYSVVTPFVKQSLSTEEMTQQFYVRCLERLPFAKDALSAEAHFGEELNRLKHRCERHARGLDSDDEPESYANPLPQQVEEPEDYGSPLRDPS